LRTPLAAMLGYVEALRTDHTLTPEERAEYLDIVFQRGTKLNEMLNDFFEFTRLEAEETPLTVEPVDLAEKAREALLLVYPEAARAGVVPKAEIPERPVWAWANAHAVDRVLHNLLVNALRHGKDGGVVGVAVREEGDRVWVAVWDGGKGIEKHDLPYIFDPISTLLTYPRPRWMFFLGKWLILIPLVFLVFALGYLYTVGAGFTLQHKPLAAQTLWVHAVATLFLSFVVPFVAGLYLF